MNFSEFEKLLGADPWNRDPETLRARNAAPEFEKAAAEAEAFERKVQGALRVAVDDALLDRVLGIAEHPPSRKLPAWVAMAASVLIVAGAAGIVWNQSQQPKSIEDYVAMHYAHDGEKLLLQASAAFDAAEISEIMSRFNMTTSDELAERVRLIKFCPTMDGRGAHMIVSSEQGPVHLIYMPATEVTDGQDILFGEMHAQLVALGGGSAAIIGRLDQPLAGMSALVRESLIPEPSGV